MTYLPLLPPPDPDRAQLNWLVLNNACLPCLGMSLLVDFALVKRRGQSKMAEEEEQVVQEETEEEVSCTSLCASLSGLCQ